MGGRRKSRSQILGEAFNEQGRQAESICLISLNIPCQKYIEQHSSYVLEIPEWVVCAKTSMFLTAAMGNTMRLALML